MTNESVTFRATENAGGESIAKAIAPRTLVLQLPLELTDLICSFIRSYHTSRGASKSLLSLTSTCKAFSRSALRMLYASPLYFIQELYFKPDGARAEQLLNSLQKPSLASLVTDLPELHLWSETIENFYRQQDKVNARPRDTPWYADGTEQIGTQWMLAMIETCPNLRQIGVHLQPSSAVDREVMALLKGRKLLKTISTNVFPRSTTSLKRSIRRHFSRMSATYADSTRIIFSEDYLHYPLSYYDDGYYDDDDDGSSDGAPTSSEEQVSSNHREVRHDGKLEKNVFEAAWLKNLQLELEDRAVSDVCGWHQLLVVLLRPAEVPSLRSLTLQVTQSAFEYRFDGVTSELAQLLHPLGPQLVELRLIHRGNWDDDGRGYSYCYNNFYSDYGPTFPRTICSAFPNISTFVFEGFSNLSVAMLSALAEHSPLLRIIDLTHSIWDNKDVRQVHQVEPNFRSLKMLEYVNLGVIHEHFDLASSGLAAAFEKRRIRFDYSRSSNENGLLCPGCGEPNCD